MRVQRLRELLVALVVEPGVAADALARAARRTGRWPAPGVPSAHASSATIDRLSKYDGMISASAPAIASNLSLVGQEAEVADVRMVGIGRIELADEHERAGRAGTCCR